MGSSGNYLTTVFCQYQEYDQEQTGIQLNKVLIFFNFMTQDLEKQLPRYKLPRNTNLAAILWSHIFIISGEGLDLETAVLVTFLFFLKMGSTFFFSFRAKSLDSDIGQTSFRISAKL